MNMHQFLIILKIRRKPGWGVMPPPHYVVLQALQIVLHSDPTLLSSKYYLFYLEEDSFFQFLRRLLMIVRSSKHFFELPINITFYLLNSNLKEGTFKVIFPPSLSGGLWRWMPAVFWWCCSCLCGVECASGDRAGTYGVIGMMDSDARLGCGPSSTV